ncbi:MAG: helicase-exonuclease AddAB subunit AddA [Roseburia sp.]
MGVSWTKEQQQVIDLRDKNILVSAAAGSGKTAVLVERIIKRITDVNNPVDIDRLLIVTFTNAAAAEMRERIGAAIEKALEEKPEDEHLLRQMTLIHNAQITTIDSFCLYVIRNHFHEIDLEPNFRIGDEGELKLLKEDVLKQVLEKNYENPTETFHNFVEGYAAGRKDDALNAMILQLYEFSRSYPWPKEWLASCIKGYEISTIEELNQAEWMQPLVQNIGYVCNDMTKLLKEALRLTQEEDGPDMYESAIRSDLEQYEALEQAKTFTEFYQRMEAISYETLSRKKFEGDKEKQEQVKNLRQQVKDATGKIKKQFFFTSPENMVEQIKRTKVMAEELVRLTMEFAEAFAKKKQEKNLVDFGDLEHFALEILVDEETKQAKKTAEEFRDNFEEIMIDEYQDSNQVQESILTAISRVERGSYNLFMVGDVKQSIYRFRLARPELFMEKFDRYQLEDSEKVENEQRIDLHKNFRSREEVLSCTNDIFYQIMHRDLGNVEYDEEAALYPGASYPKADEMMFAPEILLVDSQDELLEDTDLTDQKLLEAKMLANRIQKLKEEQLVTDKETGELRPVKYSDIVILLRSLSGWAERFVEVLNDSGIPAHTISSTGYFSATEVQIVLSMLKILDNPRQDIPLTAVLRSPICGLTDEELALLRLAWKEEPFHVCVLEKCMELSEKEENLSELEQKLKRFWTCYEKLRAMVPDTPIHELIEIMLKETGYGNYAAAMPAGDRRRANLQMLLEKAIAYENTSYKGLFHFVRYIEELQKYDVDFGEADTVGENEDVVRIMSIHKSKGLEFPVVIVAGMGKNFNKQDVRSKLVLHPDLGMGLDHMDGSRRIKSPTILKKAIAKQIDLENLGEELRVLYVALTRAKEKLILCGNKKDAAEKLEEYRRQAESGLIVENQKTALPYLQRESAMTYLDWVLPAVFAYHGRYKITLVNTEELVTEEIIQQINLEDALAQCKEEIKNAKQEEVDYLKERFSFHYPWKEDVTRKNKYSVSELKHRAMREHFEAEQEETVPVFLQEELVPYVPQFVEQKEEVNQGALRGTAVHRVMECYRFTEESSCEEQIAQMVNEGKLTKEMADLVKVPVVEAFLFSEVGKRMAEAERKGCLYREKPFVMGFSEKELADFGFGETGEMSNEEDLTLIQGIIDVFWEEEEGIVLLDYKTDRVEQAKELTDRYEAQMKLYAEALERVYADYGWKVKEMLLYSFRLKQVIPVIR